MRLDNFIVRPKRHYVIVFAIVTAGFLMSATYFATSELGGIKFSIEKLNRVD